MMTFSYLSSVPWLFQSVSETILGIFIFNFWRYKAWEINFVYWFRCRISLKLLFEVFLPKIIRGAGNCESLILRVKSLCLKHGGTHCMTYVPNDSLKCKGSRSAVGNLRHAYHLVARGRFLGGIAKWLTIMKFFNIFCCFYVDT